MKLRTKILSAIAGAVMLFSLTTGAALAYDPPDPPEANVDVEVGEVEVNGTGQVGTNVTVSSDITIVAEADTEWWLSFAEAMSQYGYTINGGGLNVDYTNGDYDFDFGFGGASASVSDSFTLSYSFMIAGPWAYSVDFFAEAFAAAFSLLPPGWDADSDMDLASAIIQGWMPHTWFDNGQFELVITRLDYSHRGYGYEVPELNGSVPVAFYPDDLPATTMDITQFGQCPGGQQIRVDLEPGTRVFDENGDPVYKLLLIYNWYYGLDAPYIEFVNADRPGSQVGTEINFSNPLEISKGSAYNPFISITQVVDGIVVID